MSRRLRCTECDHPMTIVKGRASEARPSSIGILRDKRCPVCGHRTTTVELRVGDIPALVRAYMTVDLQN